MKVTMSTTVIRILAAMIVAAGFTACTKDNGSIDLRQVSEENLPIEFSAYNSTMPTKAIPYYSDQVLGKWDSDAKAYIPGTGVGIFAFYQKAKSNGYPTYFNKNIGEPTYMYNQKLERTSADGETFDFTYTPQKYWPNNTNDQLSFFAYAPYDESTAWEDLQIVSDLKGTKITRHYVVENEVTDQTDFLWADPILNKKKPSVGTRLCFNFRHLCARIGVTAVCNHNPFTPYLTVDTLSFSGRFIKEGTLEYDVATSTCGWKNLQRAAEDQTYYPFREEYSYNSSLGRDTSNAIRVSHVEHLAHPEDCYMFLLPGTQDIKFHYTLSQRNPNTGDVFNYTADTLFTNMHLEAGKAYNFKLSVTLKPISISSVSFKNIDVSTSESQYIP